MRFAPIALTLFFYAWLFLGAQAWVVVSLRSARGPALRLFPLALTGGALGGVAPVLAGQRGVAGFLLSFPLAFVVALVVAAAADRAWRRQTR